MARGLEKARVRDRERGVDGVNEGGRGWRTVWQKRHSPSCTPVSL